MLSNIDTKIDALAKKECKFPSNLIHDDVDKGNEPQTLLTTNKASAVMTNHTPVSSPGFEFEKNKAEQNISIDHKDLNESEESKNAKTVDLSNFVNKLSNTMTAMELETQRELM